MLRIVDASSGHGAKLDAGKLAAAHARVQLPNEAFLLLEGDGELLVQLIRDEQLDLQELQKATLYIHAITDRNRSSLGYFRAIEFLETAVLR